MAMGLRHDNPNLPPQSQLRAQRLTADESRAVIDLWQRERVEQTGLTDHPAVPDVAEGLDIPVEEVQRLLVEVRARRLEEERLLAQEQAQIGLAEEENRLAAIQLQRAELRLVEVGRGWQAPDQWQRPAVLPRLKRGKPRHIAPTEWTGDEDFWKETEEDKEARTAYRANQTKRTTRYVFYTVLLLFFVCSGWTLIMLLANLFMAKTQ